MNGLRLWSRLPLPGILLSRYYYNPRRRTRQEIRLELCRFTARIIQNPMSMSVSRRRLLLTIKYVFVFLRTAPGLPQASLQPNTRTLRRTSRVFLE
jgi:hypothetical protein